MNFVRRELFDTGISHYILTSSGLNQTSAPARETVESNPQNPANMPFSLMAAH